MESHLKVDGNTNNPLLSDLAFIEQTINEFNAIRRDFEASKPDPYRKDFRKLFLRRANVHIQRLSNLIERSASSHYHTDFGLYVGSFIDRSMLIKRKRWELLIKGIRAKDEKYLDEADILERRFLKIHDHIDQTFRSIVTKTKGATQSSDSESALFDFQEEGDVNGR